jgi:hypothetical protein
MAIADVGRAFEGVNEHAPANPDGNCMHCAVETAEALTKGRIPARVDGSISRVEEGGVPMLQLFRYELPDRASLVLRYLRHQAPAGVYAVDVQDHAYNFIVLPNRQVYLIDSNQLIFRQINTEADFQAIGHNDTLDDEYDYDYGSPERVEDKTDMEFYYWGALHPRYHLMLTSAHAAWFGTGGAFRRVERTAARAFTID